MIEYANITRRSFLNIFIYLSVIGLIKPSHALAKAGKLSKPDPLCSKLSQFFINKESASVIGREYLRRVPNEANATLLVDLISSSSAERRLELTKADTKKLRELLLLQQRQDFEDGRIVKVQGWILSETEVRLCALAALN